MIHLSNDQVEIIRLFVLENMSRMPKLKDDVIDHLCCETEVFMTEGKNFEEALRLAIYELAPHGLSHIERQTYFMLNHKILINMKRITFIIGTAATMSMALGWLLKVLHIAGLGNQFFALGAAAFVLLFLPMISIQYFRSNARSLTQRLRMVLGIVSAILLAIAALAKMMRLPGADDLLLVGGLLFIFGFIPVLFYHLYKRWQPQS